MKKHKVILEHEILKVLYIKTSHHIGGYTRGDGKTVITAKRDYKDATLYFGTLVDVLNMPDKYASDAYKALQGLDRMQEEINIDTYSFGQVSDAIQVLVSNGQVIDIVIENIGGKQSGSRKINLTDKGALDYRNKFYIKQWKEEKLSRKKLKLDMKNAERIYKSYPATRFIAWTGFIFAAIGLYLSIARAINIWPFHK